MRARHPPRRSVPTRWLMTDERQGDALWAALARLPRGGGIVFRHYRTPAAARRGLFARIARIARRRGLLLVRGGAQPLRGEGGVHGRRRRGGQAKPRGSVTTWPAHDGAQAVAGVRAGACVLFVSPAFATRSHPGAAALGPLRAAAIARRAGPRIAAIALGGMNERRFRRLRGLGFAGYAAIDGWSDQKRKAVPT